MDKKIIILASLIVTIYGQVFSMQERETPVSSKIKTYLDQLPFELVQMINNYKLPDELLIPVLTALAEGKTLKEALDTVNKFRLANKRFDNLINSKPFMEHLINFLSKKYAIPKAVIAVAWGIPGAIEWLKLQEKVVVNEMDDRDLTALMYAARAGNLNVVKLLVERGADVNQRTFPQPYTALTYASGSNHPEVVKYLIENGANLNNINQVDEYGQTILFDAINNGNIELVEILIKKGANLNVRSAWEKTPLGTALNLLNQVKDTETMQKIVDLLKKAGATE